MKKILLFLIAVVFATAAVAAPKFNPRKPIEIIVPYAVGGGTSAHAHLVAEIFTEYGWPTLVINRPGGDAVIGANSVAESIPDGTTIMVGAASAMSSNLVFTPPGIKYTEKSFVPVSLLNQFGLVLSVPADSPIKNYEQFKFYVKTNPEKFNLGFHNGPQSNIFYQWAKEEGLPRPNIIIYKGSGPMNTDLLGGHIPFMWDNYTSPIVPMVKAGKIRVIATLDSVSLEQIKHQQHDAEDVVDLSRRLPDLRFGVYYGLFAPAGTPKEVVLEMNQVLNNAAKDPRIQEKIKTLDIKNWGGKPEDLLKVQHRYIELFKKLPKEDR
jgi:tripartite-type tricarboxylate transporter receptor subunit TctC